MEYNHLTLKPIHFDSLMDLGFVDMALKIRPTLYPQQIAYKQCHFTKIRPAVLSPPGLIHALKPFAFNG